MSCSDWQLGQSNLVVTVYRAPWATLGDTNEMCSALDDLITKYKRIVMVDDFNFASCSAGVSSMVHCISKQYSRIPLGVFGLDAHGIPLAFFKIPLQ